MFLVELQLLLIQISNFCICFCNFDLSSSILEKYNWIEDVYIVLFCLIK